MNDSHCRAIIGPVLGLLACIPVASVVSATELQPVTVERLSERVVVATTPLLGRNNVVAIATRKGLVLIDTGACPFIAGELKRELEKQLGRTDWAYVLNTHVHDHTGGNALFKDVPIIAHENAVEDTKRIAEFLASEEKKAPSLRALRGQLEKVQEQLDSGAGDGENLRGQLAFWQGIESDIVKGFEVIGPSVTFTDELTLDMGDVTIRAAYLGRGHSQSDIAVYVPEEKLLVAGGACGPGFPKISDTVGIPDIERSMALLDRLLESGIEHVVSGHAEPKGREIAEQRRDYYRDLLAGVRAARAQNLTLEQAQAALGVEQRFPYMREAKVFQGTLDEAQAANVAAVYKLVQP